MGRGRVWVVVLGDFGRSPRMQYHTLSLATQAGKHVDVVACGGSEPLAEILEHRSITLHTLPEPPAFLAALPRTLALPLKALFQALALLLMMLLWLPAPDALLLQVPPAIPTLPLCWLACRWHRAVFIIDWHNFAYTLMALSTGPRHPLARPRPPRVQLAQRFEKFWGRRAQRHLCVTRAMQAELARSWRIEATVFYDRPPAHFRPATLAEKHELLLRLRPELETPVHPHDCCAPARAAALGPEGAAAGAAGAGARVGAAANASELDGCNGGGGGGSVGSGVGVGASGRVSGAVQGVGEHASPGRRPSRAGRGNGTVGPPSDGGEEVTLCTRRPRGGPVELRADRPALVVSSTSWTPDEDFGTLLAAARLYEAQARAAPGSLPRLLVAVTGRGPQRAAFVAALAAEDLRHVAFRTLWLAPADYPRLLGAADLGVSLHTSSSGLDLPMKVVDMFGCGLPVCAAAYACIGELVAHGDSGLLFAGPGQLASQLAELLAGFPGAEGRALARMRHTAAAAAAVTWGASWRSVVLPLFAA